MLPIYLAIIFYLVMAYFFLNEWLDFFLSDKDLTTEQRFISYIVLIIGTIFWPIVVPIAYLELLKFNKKHREIFDLIKNPPSSRISDVYDE